jgi:glucuronoarabinoxylan endo-1,4-beta-xylanase
MQGFGLNDSWAPAFTDAQADQLFDPTNGIGLSILRIGMGSDGNPLSNNIWGDIGKAKARGVTTFIASVWSAPANCKSNNSVNDGGHLSTSCYDSWATTIAAFPSKVKTNAGVDLYGMSPANEPEFASCGTAKPCNGNYPTMLFTADEAVAFIKVVGPKLHALSPAVKVMTPEPSEWIHLWTNNSAPGSTNPLNGQGYDYGHALSKDTTAWAQIDIVGVHEYDTQVAEPWPSDVPQAKPIWQTEMSGVKWWPEEGPSSDINNGVVVAGWIHDAIVNGPASAWLWWWYQAQSTDDNEGLVLKNGTVAKRLYTLGNFSKFIRPGYTRVDISGSPPSGVELSAYKNPSDGTVVVVAINTGTSSVSMPIGIGGGTAPSQVTPWVTSANDDLASKAALPLSSSSFTATLGGKTVTTFVGK